MWLDLSTSRGMAEETESLQQNSWSGLCSRIWTSNHWPCQFDKMKSNGSIRERKKFISIPSDKSKLSIDSCTSLRWILEWKRSGKQFNLKQQFCVNAILNVLGISYPMLNAFNIYIYSFVLHSYCHSPVIPAHRLKGIWRDGCYSNKRITPVNGQLWVQH